ncbi:DNA primase [Hominenteromicrobium sp.]|uniref:DNA primase n=1 Tax=Hominenteromicrobium sp. TaxID=3073581 RepID=UPI003A94141B
MPLPESFMQDLKSRCDITDIVSSYVNLKRRGKNMVGLCPFHNEKSPSFNVYPENNSFYCFGCGAGGDVITFIRKIENLDYIEAVKMLADRVGLQMPEQGVDDSMSRLRQRVLEINRESARFFHSALLSLEGKPGLDYFVRRRLPMKMIRHFGLGWAPESRFALVNHLRSKGYSEREMIAANVAVETRSGRAMDRFHARVMFPIIDLRGNVVAFGGRILTNEKPKYINTSDTPVYHKSSGLFAMNFAKNALENDRIILAEGYMDVISLHKAGIENAIASLGTALTAEQARIIARYAKEVVICYDSDEAGQKAAQRAIPILRGAGLLVRVMAVPGNKDPDEFINACGDEGAARFRRLIEQSGNDVEYRLAKLKSGYDLSNENGRIQYLMAAVELLAGLENAIERDVYVSRLSQELNVDKNAILQQMSVSVRKKARAAQRQQQRDMTEQLSARRDTVNPEKRRYVRVANAEERLIACLFHNNDLAQSLNRRVPPEKFVTAFNRRLYQSLLGKIINEETVTSPQITDFSAECTPDEMGRLAKIVQENAGITAKDAEEYVQIILSEGALTDTDKVRGANPADLQAQLDALRKQKK